MSINETQVSDITRAIGTRFRTFGGGESGPFNNPVAHALRARPLSFAADVDVADVVRFVLESAASAAPEPRADAPQLLALIRDALPHISQEVDERKHSGNDEYFAELESIEQRMVDALRAPLPVYLVAYDTDAEDSPVYACAFSSKAAAERFAASGDGGHVIETGIDTHAITAEEAESVAEEAADKVRRRMVGRRRARGKVARRTHGEG